MSIIIVPNYPVAYYYWIIENTKYLAKATNLCSRHV